MILTIDNPICTIHGQDNTVVQFKMVLGNGALYTYNGREFMLLTQTGKDTQFHWFFDGKDTTKVEVVVMFVESKMQIRVTVYSKLVTLTNY
jgi:hypothetical protein